MAMHESWAETPRGVNKTPRCVSKPSGSGRAEPTEVCVFAELVHCGRHACEMRRVHHLSSATEAVLECQAQEGTRYCTSTYCHASPWFALVQGRQTWRQHAECNPHIVVVLMSTVQAPAHLEETADKGGKDTQLQLT
jgi:hypothetical protein